MLYEVITILIAFYNGIPAGCKIAYDRFGNKIFYSWLGGVLPEFRRKNIAKTLSEKMEEMAQIRGYEFIRFKTRNKFTSVITSYSIHYTKLYEPC